MVETHEKLGKNDGRNGENMVPEAETAKHHGNGRNGPFTSNTVGARENWAKTMIGMAKTWYRRPKWLNVGKRKKQTIHVGYGGNT